MLGLNEAIFRNLDEESLGKWQWLQHCNSKIPSQKVEGMTTNVGSTFSVGDTIPQITISIEQNN